MSEIWVLLFFSSAMLIGCYLAGMIPLVVSLSEDKLQLVTVLGAGLLVGTALSVIIPEGVNALYSSQIKQIEEFQHGHHEHSTAAEQQADIHGIMELEPHSVIGVALVLGFVFMLLIDQISSAHSRPQGTDLESSIRQDRQKITATIGLVVHAAADGIALGAAVTTSHTDIEMIVFTAIMLHKAPAAFGLVTFLLHEGLDRARIRRHLLIFALAAPTLAVITYFGISQSTKERLSSMNATGIAMLFSAGTFLYVATVHVLPEIASGHGDSKSFRKRELFALVVGAFLPLVFSAGHHH